MLVQQVVREFISIVQSDQCDGLLTPSFAWRTDDEGICDVRASSPGLLDREFADRRCGPPSCAKVL